jgi:toxin ParE1/3/4
MSGFAVAPAAAADLDAIVDFIARDSIDAAAAWVEMMYDRFSYLAQSPGVGTPRDDLRPGLRSLAAGDYLVLYIRTRGAVTILRVVHGKRNLPGLFQNP